MKVLRINGTFSYRLHDYEVSSVVALLTFLRLHGVLDFELYDLDSFDDKEVI